MAKTIVQKLRIQPGSELLTLNAPAEFKKELVDLPSGVRIVTASSKPGQIHWFVTSKAQLEKELSKVMKLLREDNMVWVYYPKGSSGLQQDLTRDKGWDCLLSHGDRLTWISLISFNDTWSVFGFRAKSVADKQKESKPNEQREIFKWVDPVKKTVKLPEELAAAFRKNGDAKRAFEKLSFTNKKEYLEWIVTAKREETKQERLKGTMERLEKGWKNPSNR